MPIRFLAAGFIVAGALLSIAPAAVAEPVPGPDPVPVPTPSIIGDGGGCQGGEVMRNGNCVPNMTPVTTDEDDEQAAPEAPLRYSDSHSSTSVTGAPTDLVPNLNGTPCTGYWMSGACYAEAQDNAPAVVPRSTLSDSP